MKTYFIGITGKIWLFQTILLDWENIPRFIDNVKNWDNHKLTVLHNSVAGEKPLDEYDENGHQKVTRFMDQEIADFIYEKDNIIFKLGNYNKDSWK